MRSIIFLSTATCLLVTMFLSGYGKTAERVFPQRLTIGTTNGLFLPVQFDHQLHAGYCSCVECHHHTTGLKPSNPYCLDCHQGQEPSSEVSCRSCHRSTPWANEDRKNLPERFHTDIPGAKGAYHISCINCHEATSSGPTACEGCHGLTEKGRDFYRVNHTGPKHSYQREELP